MSFILITCNGIVRNFQEMFNELLGGADVEETLDPFVKTSADCMSRARGIDGELIEELLLTMKVF